MDCNVGPANWLHSIQDPEESATADKGQSGPALYVWSVYWALATLTSTGYGDVHAVTVSEQWYSAACMLTGAVLFGYLLGSLTSTLTNQEALRARFEQGFQALASHMQRECVPLPLRSRIHCYLQQLWSQKNGRSEDELFGRLPFTLRSEVALASAAEMIVRVPSFANCETSLLRMIALALKPTLFQPQEEIISFGNVIPAMYFIVSGTVYISDKNGQVHRKLSRGAPKKLVHAGNSSFATSPYSLIPLVVSYCFHRYCEQLNRALLLTGRLCRRTFWRSGNGPTIALHCVCHGIHVL